MRNISPAMSLRLCAALCLMAALTGCSSYSFRIMRPENLQKIITDSPAHLQTANMSYQMQAREGRLVVQIYNEQDQVVQLVGDKSFVVDTASGSHPLRSIAIAPHSFAKLILPPLRPRFEDTPQWNFGVSGGMGSASRASPSEQTAGLLPSEGAASRPGRGGEGAVPTHATPLYLDYYEEADAFYWDWDVTRPIRLSITYRFANGQQATDEFTIDKVKR